MINNVVLVGRLTRDAELRYTQSNIAVATFTLAVNRPFKNEAGERDADFINCVIWRQSAENLANWAKKGSLIGITGVAMIINKANVFMSQRLLLVILNCWKSVTVSKIIKAIKIIMAVISNRVTATRAVLSKTEITQGTISKMEIVTGNKVVSLRGIQQIHWISVMMICHSR